MIRHVNIGVAELAVFDQGSGRPLMFVHGFPLDHRMWKFQLEDLAADHRVLAPDLRGFGATAPREDQQSLAGIIRMEQLADDLAAVLLMLRIREPVTLIGLSMGGYIAWQFARNYSSRLRALVLCNTRAAADSREAAEARLTMAERVLAEGAAPLAESLLPRLFARQTFALHPNLVELVRGMILAAPPAALAAAQRGMADRPDMTGELGSIRVPTLVMVGAEDQISPPDEMRAIANTIPGAQFVEVPAAGHLAPLENAVAVNAALRKFLHETG